MNIMYEVEMRVRIAEYVLRACGARDTQVATTLKPDCINREVHILGDGIRAVVHVPWVGGPTLTFHLGTRYPVSPDPLDPRAD